MKNHYFSFQRIFSKPFKTHWWSILMCLMLNLS